MPCDLQGIFWYVVVTSPDLSEGEEVWRKRECGSLLRRDDKAGKYYISNRAFIGSLPKSMSSGASRSSLTRTRKPTDSRPSMMR